MAKSPSKKERPVHDKFPSAWEIQVVPGRTVDRYRLSRSDLAVPVLRLSGWAAELKTMDMAGAE